ncbi:hypothetical protein Tco_0299508 [Tanacetum coccineum]
MLRLPATIDNDHWKFQKPPTSQQVVEFFNDLGFDNDAKKITKISDFKRKFLPLRGDNLFSILNYCLTGKEAGTYADRLFIYQISMVCLQLDAKTTTKKLMHIPQELLDLANNNTVVKPSTMDKPKRVGVEKFENFNNDDEMEKKDKFNIQDDDDDDDNEVRDGKDGGGARIQFKQSTKDISTEDAPLFSTVPPPTTTIAVTKPKPA